MSFPVQQHLPMYSMVSNSHNNYDQKPINYLTVLYPTFPGSTRQMGSLFPLQQQFIQKTKRERKIKKDLDNKSLFYTGKMSQNWSEKTRKNLSKKVSGHVRKFVKVPCVHFIGNLCFHISVFDRTTWFWILPTAIPAVADGFLSRDTFSLGAVLSFYRFIENSVK